MSELKRRIFSNSIWLISYQLPNYALYLVLLPILTRTYDSSIIASFFLIQGVVRFFLVITEFGFDFSVTRLLLESEGNLDEQSRLYSLSLYSKLLLYFSFLPLFIIIFSMLNYDDDFILSTAFLLMPLSLAFNSNYIFLSKSSIRVMALANMIAKSSVIILVFIAVNYSLDIGYIVIFIVVSNLVVGIYLTRLIRSRYSIRMTGFRLFEVLRFIGANKEMAISHAYVAFFGNALSFFYSGISYIHSFSIYYAYDKIITAFKILVNTTSQAVFPAIHEQTKDAFKNEVVRVFSILVVSFLLYLVSIMAGPYLFNIYLGADFINDVSLLRLMFIFIIIQPLSAYLMNVKLISKGLSKLHMRAHLIQLILFLGIMLIAKKLGEGLTLYRMLGIQLFVQSIMIIYVQMQTRVNGK